MSREVTRRIKATVLRPHYRLVCLETATGDGLGTFEIPAGKDPDEWMRRIGYFKAERSDEGDVWLKPVTLT